MNLEMIGPGYSSRGAIRERVGVPAKKICELAYVTRGTLTAWEERHDAWLPGRFTTMGRGSMAHAITRLADVYAALMWIACGSRQPAHLDDAPLRAAIARIQTLP